MKKRLVQSVMLALLLAASTASAQTLLSDSFDNYQAGFFPPSESGWFPLYQSLNDPSSNYVTTGEHSDGTQSLQLAGSPYGCWAADAVYSIVPPSVFFVDVDLKGSGRVRETPGCHRTDMTLSLGTEYTSCCFYGVGMVMFWLNPEGQLQVNGMAGSLVSPYDPAKWYRFKMKVVPFDGTIDYWVDGVHVGQQYSDYLVQNAAAIKYLKFESGDGKGWIDRVRVYQTTPMAVQVDPETLNVRSGGRWVTAYLQSPTADPAQIRVASVVLTTAGGAVIPVAADAPSGVGDFDGNGVPELMVKFDRAALSAALAAEVTTSGSKVALTAAGEMNDGTLLEGVGSLRVIF